MQNLYDYRKFAVLYVATFTLWRLDADGRVPSTASYRLLLALVVCVTSRRLLGSARRRGTSIRAGWGEGDKSR